MRKLPLLLMLSLLGLVFAGTFSACGDDDDDLEQYREWIVSNNKWIKAKEAELNPETGEPMYVKVVPSYDVGAYVLMRWINDRKETEKNLSPYYTSTVDVKYIGYLYDGTPFDSSYLLTSNGDSIFRTDVKSVIQGWQIALQMMHAGDSCEVIIPFQSAYGNTGSGDIMPYSNLRFNMRLKDVHKYEIK